MHITVAICTWNRSKLLDQTLTQMRNLRIPDGVTWELLVVNNNCSDDTDAILERHREQLPLRRLFEAQQGLSYARNCALVETTSDWVVFTDDDVLVCDDWLARYTAAAMSADENVAFLGGEVQPWFEATPSPTYLAAFGSLRIGFCGVPPQPKTIIRCREDKIPVGASFAVRRSRLGDLKFDVRLGIKGAQRLMFEEQCLMMDLLALGYEGRWVHGAVLRHFVPADRCTLRYLVRYYFGLGRTRAIAGGHYSCASVFYIELWAVRLLAKHATLALASAAMLNRVAAFSSAASAVVYSGIAWERFCNWHQYNCVRLHSDSHRPHSLDAPHAAQ